MAFGNLQTRRFSSRSRPAPIRCPSSLIITYPGSSTLVGSLFRINSPSEHNLHTSSSESSITFFWAKWPNLWINTVVGFRKPATFRKKGRPHRTNAPSGHFIGDDWRLNRKACLENANIS